MQIGLTGKVVVVTGAATGIGREICTGLAANGAQVIGVDVADLGETGDQVQASGAGGESAHWMGVRIDLASPETVRKGCREILKAHPSVDVLVNNAALYGGLKLTPMEAIDLLEWDRVMDINVRGTYLMIRELLPALKQARGKVINLASGSALRGSPFLLHYVASKGAIIAMTRALATELGAYGIRVNAIAPGLVDNESSRGLGDRFPGILESTVEQQAVKEPLRATDVVGIILFLASSWGDAVTGQTLPVDKGLTRS